MIYKLSRVLSTFQVVNCAGKPIERVVYSFYGITMENICQREENFVYFRGQDAYSCQLHEMTGQTIFIRETNEPVMVNQAKLFPSNYTNRVVHLFTALLQSIVHMLKLIYIFSHVLTVKTVAMAVLLLILLCTFLKFSTYT